MDLSKYRLRLQRPKKSTLIHRIIKQANKNCGKSTKLVLLSEKKLKPKSPQNALELKMSKCSNIPHPSFIRFKSLKKIGRAGGIFT